MKLGKLNVTTGAQKAPLRELVYGTEGVGKTSFAADAPAPIFVGEDGTKRLEVARIDTPQTWEEVKLAIATLRTERHDFKTLVLDTLDFVERLLFDQIAKGAGVRSIELIPFGKGYKVAVDAWAFLLRELERLQREKGMNVILLAHAQIKTFKNPTGDDFDRYVLKIREDAAALVKGWAESVIFASFDVSIAKGKKLDASSRWLYTERTTAFDAKNRYGLPKRLELSFPEFLRLCDRPPAEIARELRRSAESLLPQIASDEKRRKAAEVLAEAKDSRDLRQVLGRIHATIAAQDEAAERSSEDEAVAAEATAEESPAVEAPAAPAQAGTASVPSAPSSPPGDPPPPAPGSPHDDEVDFPAAPSWSSWTTRDVLARIGPAQRAHAQDVVAAFKVPAERATCSLAIFNLLLGLNEKEPGRVSAWWKSVGGNVSVVTKKTASGGTKHEFAASILTGEQLGRLLMGCVEPVFEIAPEGAGAAS